jgi:polysaccharide biosynthesis protein PslG
VRRIALAALLAAGLTLSLASPASAGARATAPRGFFGVVPQGPLAPPDFKHMQGVVGTLRIPVYWPQVEPRRGELDFTGLDAIVTAAAGSGVRVLPFVYGTPGWLAADPARPPLSAKARSSWARFLHALVRRYGSGGTLWDGASKPMAIRQWQVWNEPNFLLFWRPRPSPAGYARMLRVSAAAIRGVDPGARIVAAGLAPVEGGMLPWTFLRKLYEVPGVRRSIDTVALHPYSSTLGGMTYQIRKARQVMAAAGDGRAPLLISELGIASSSLLPTGFNRGLKGQASFLRQAYRLLLRARDRWHLAGVDWYAWQDMSTPDPHCVFCEFAGLFDSGGEPKPAWRALRQVVAAVAKPVR